MAHTQRKCSSSNDDLNSFRITEEDKNFVCTMLNFIDATYHTGMADNSYTVQENGEHLNSRSQNFHLDSDDNAVDGWNKGVPPLPVCTSTPCTGRCQYRLLDSVALLSQEDSGLGGSLTSCWSSSSVTPPKADILCPSTPVLSLSGSLSQTDSPPPSKFDFEYLSPRSYSADSPLQNAEANTPAMSSLEEWWPESLLTMRDYSSTPLSLSLSALIMNHGAGALVTSTPVDGDSPVTGQTLQQLRQETPAASDAVISMTGPLFQNHRPNTDSRALCSPSPPPRFPRSDSSSQDGESEDEAYFSSHLLSLTFPSLTAVDEESSQNLALVQGMQQMLHQCTPNPASRLIGRHVGVEHVDIIMELHQRDLPACGVFAWLSPYLQPADYIRMSLVCRQWRQACLEDKMVSKYRKLCMRIHNRPDEKENSLHVKDGSGDEVQAMTRACTCLGEVQVTAPPSPVKHVLSCPELYEKARKSLRWEELLRHCPLCHSVAKVAKSQEWAQCQNQQCLNEFCTRCLASYHPTLPCPSQPHTVRDPAGSRKSKKQLKRISIL